MTRWLWLLLTILLLGAMADERTRAEDLKTVPAAAKAVEQIAAAVRPSVVVIESTGRDGRRQGLGTGFVVADGLIATNLHVIGEARPVTIRLADGKRFEASAVHATDRASDLAVVRIDANGIKPLELADADALAQGQAVVAVGNPQGLEHSVVSGVVSGRRDIDGVAMIQIAIPIEPGNSGGPLLDLNGRVHGLLTLKSAVTANLGFAVPVKALRALLEKPNPIPMARWLTIGALDAAEWKQVGGARWRQRAGRITVEGAGGGFGARSLCLSARPVPATPFEVEVTVKLDDEGGAAGLVFHADGGDRHYGFYPTAGSLRLTRFEGPDVFSWTVLEQKKSQHYRPGDWNTIKVRVEKEKLLCYVNDHLLIESTDSGLKEGQVGLAKFRDTKAEFRQFQVAKQLPPRAVAGAVVERITKTVQDISPRGPVKAEMVDALLADGAAGRAVLRERARLLEQQAVQLRQLAQALHQKQVQTELVPLLQGKEEEIDLGHAALLVAKLDNDEVDVPAYRRELDRLGRELREGLPKDAADQARLAALNKFLFAERGFHGSRGDYYHRSNSYLNEVMDDREGLPITLAVLYIELGRRVGLKIEGVPLPGHFVVRLVPAKGETSLLDVYEGGKELPLEEAKKRVEAATGRPLEEEQLKPATKKAIVDRIVRNLMGLANRDRDGERLLRYLDVVLALNADNGPDHWMRAVLRYHAGQRQGALEDVEWVLEHEPEGVDRRQVMELRRLLTRPE